MSKRLVVFALLVLGSFARGQSEPDKMKAIEGLVRAHVGWGPALNSGGLSVVLAETARDGGEFVYELRGTGTKPGTVYQLYQWPVTKTGPVLFLDGVTFDETGRAVCTGEPRHCGSKQQGLQPVVFRMRPTSGEPIRIALAGANKDGRAYFQITPVPIAADDKGCRLEATLISPHGAILYVEGRGFPANGNLTISSDSEGERHTSSAVSTPAGEYRTIVLPGVLGKTSGVLKYAVSAGDCKPTVESRWANETNRD